MLPEDQQIKYKYNFVEQKSGEKQSARTAFENSLKMPVEMWERPISEVGVNDRSSGAILFVDFENEAQILTTVRHDSILRVYDYCSKNGYHYLATEITGGNNLQELLREKPEIFTTANVLNWSAQLINALDYLHTQAPPLIHGEIKPENIILTANGRIKILPFEIAARAGAAAESDVRHFDVAGLHYSPLEQIWSSLDSASQKTLLRNYDETSEQVLRRPLDEQSDVYALGATLYYLFTHRLPIDALERSIDLLDGKKDPLIAPSVIDSAIPVEISDLLMKSLAIKRENRTTSAAMMLKVVNQFLVKTQPPAREAAKAAAVVVADKIKLPVENPVSPIKISAKPATVQTPVIKQESRIEEIKNLSEELPEPTFHPQISQVNETKAPAPPKIIEELLPEKTVEEQNVVQVLDSEYHSARETTDDDSSIIQDEKPVSKIESKISSPVAAPVFENVFVAPPQNGSRRMVMIALVLMLMIGGSAFAVWKIGISKPTVMQQTVSAEEKIPNLPPQIQAAPAETEASAANDQTVTPIAEKNAPVAETLEIEQPQSETARESGVPQISKNKSVVLPRNARQTASPIKAVSEKKKTVTVDDLISDN